MPLPASPPNPRETIARLAEAGRSRGAIQLASGHRNASEIAANETGLSWPERIVGSFFAASSSLVVVGFARLPRSLELGLGLILLAVPIWFVSVVLAIPVFGGAAVLMGMERRFMSRLPVVVDGYLELLERSRLVEVVRVRIRLRTPTSVADPTLLMSVMLGFGAEHDVRGDAQAVEAFFAVGKPRAWRFRKWFRALAASALIPLNGAFGVARVELDER